MTGDKEKRWVEGEPRLHEIVKALEELVAEGVIEERYDEESGELVYQATEKVFPYVKEIIKDVEGYAAMVALTYYATPELDVHARLRSVITMLYVLLGDSLDDAVRKAKEVRNEIEELATLLKRIYRLDDHEAIILALATLNTLATGPA